MSVLSADNTQDERSEVYLSILNNFNRIIKTNCNDFFLDILNPISGRVYAGQTN